MWRGRCLQVGFQSHCGCITFQDEKNISLELPAVSLVAFGGLQNRWDTGVERVGGEGLGRRREGVKKIMGPGEERVDEHPPSPHP